MTTYTLAFNRHDNKWVRYANPADAEKQGIKEYVQIECESFREAKEIAIEQRSETTNTDSDE